MKPGLPQAWDQAAKALNSIPLAGERVRYAAAIKPLLSLPKNARILEVGCGSGRLLRALEVLGYQHLVGMEISHARLSYMAQRRPSVAGLVCSSEVPFAAATFNAVVSAAVIEHVVNPPDWLAELTRVIQPEGFISIVTDTYIWHWLKRLGLYRSIQPLDEAIWPWRLIRWGQEAGLELVGSGGFVNTPNQRGYFGKQLLRLVPYTGRLRHWLNRTAAPVINLDETTAILDAVREFLW